MSFFAENRQKIAEIGYNNDPWPLYVYIRVARFFLVHDYKTGKNVPNEQKLIQTVKNYPKYL
jgi:hypothetical protein